MDPSKLQNELDVFQKVEEGNIDKQEDGWFDYFQNLGFQVGLQKHSVVLAT